MKKAIMILTALASLAATAKTIPSTTEKISPASINRVVPLVYKTTEGVVKLNFIVTDHGLSTDVSPRHTIYLGFSNYQEMGNVESSFKITDEAYEFISARRVSAGIYEVVVREYQDTMVIATYTVDATKVFADEKELRKKCGGDFCDTDLKSSVIVTRQEKADKN